MEYQLKRKLGEKGTVIFNIIIGEEDKEKIQEYLESNSNFITVSNGMFELEEDLILSENIEILKSKEKDFLNSVDELFVKLDSLILSESKKENKDTVAYNIISTIIKDFSSALGKEELINLSNLCSELSSKIK